MKKRNLIIPIIIIPIIIIRIIINYADTARVSTGHEPKYCIKVIGQDGSILVFV